MKNQSADSSQRPVKQGDVTFLMVGCQRCGSTWVDKALRGHPEIHLPPQKQTYYYDRSHDKGLDWYLSRLGPLKPGAKAVGEVATGYSLLDVFPNVNADFPDIKIIMSVRNPVDRAASYYRSRKDKFGWTSIEEAIADDPLILERGMYRAQIEQILSLVAPENFLLLFYDDLIADDRAYLRSILQFLGVDDTYDSPALGRRIQVSAFGRLRKLAKRLRLGWLADWISRSWIGDLLRQYLARKTKRQPKNADRSHEHEILAEYYPEPFSDLRKYARHARSS